MIIKNILLAHYFLYISVILNKRVRKVVKLKLKFLIKVSLKNNWTTNEKNQPL
jgi:hypothetical protein